MQKIGNFTNSVILLLNSVFFCSNLLFCSQILVFFNIFFSLTGNFREQVTNKTILGSSSSKENKKILNFPPNRHFVDSDSPNSAKQLHKIHGFLLI